VDLPFEDGEFVGNFHLFPYEKTGISSQEMMALPAAEQIYEIAYDIRPELFGRGVGKGMIKAGLGFAKWMGIEKVVAVS
jgi:RimJ/RimL family protein N-acetyltransferase